MDESAEPHLNSKRKPTITRREALAIAAAPLLPKLHLRSPAPKKIIVAGAGIGGLSCAWELVRRGHDVTVVEASGRTGGHVMTFRDGLDDALYADAGAEHFTQPGYERYWGYVREFNLAHAVLSAPGAPAAMDRRTHVHARNVGRSKGARDAWPEPSRGRLPRATSFSRACLAVLCAVCGQLHRRVSSLRCRSQRTR